MSNRVPLIDVIEMAGLWAEVDTYAPMSARKFRIVGTGQEFEAGLDHHDMAQLRRDAAEHVVERRRDADLIDELRRQLAAVTRYVDGITRMRRTIVPGDTEAVLAEALI